MVQRTSSSSGTLHLDLHQWPKDQATSLVEPSCKQTSISYDTLSCTIMNFSEQEWMAHCIGVLDVSAVQSVFGTFVLEAGCRLLGQLDMTNVGAKKCGDVRVRLKIRRAKGSIDFTLQKCP